MKRGWPKERIQRFVKDWNDGVTAAGLKEKYGLKSLDSTCHEFRTRGYVLIPRLERWKKTGMLMPRALPKVREISSAVHRPARKDQGS